jgi:hypothetical protein
VARPEVTGRKPAAVGRKRRSRPLTPPACFSVASFCVAHHISEAFYYKLKSQGLGPREMQVGARILVTYEAAADWRAEREAATAATSTAAE